MIFITDWSFKGDLTIFNCSSLSGGSSIQFLGSQDGGVLNWVLMVQKPFKEPRDSAI